MSKVNPFTPNSPVHVGIFAGRDSEIEAIDKGLLQAAHSNPTHILLLGERGIGKTSLLNVANMFAKGKFKWADRSHSFIVSRVSLSDNMCFVDFAIVLKNAIQRAIDKEHSRLAMIKKTWEFLSRFEAAGVAYRREESSKNSAAIMQDFIYSVSDTIRSLKDPKLPKTEKRMGWLY